MISTARLSGVQDTRTIKSLIQGKRSDSPEPSCVSMKSDRSMTCPVKVRDSSDDLSLIQDKRSDSPEPSCVSMKSDRSMTCPVKLRDSSDDLSCVSMKSAWSMHLPVIFRQEDSSTDLGTKKETKTSKNICLNTLESIFKELEHKAITLLKNELKKFKKLLSPDYPACSEMDMEDKEDLSCVRDGALKITLHILNNMAQPDLAVTLQTSKSSRS
ncbi:hypothetical protein PDJAM_G00207180 [Pangasius djambal]|uniref:Uncharacterized protein n=1 Tax=Pangasius djambal TaxID=1691987 RepID=A0ACC5Y9R1_9TELE|nr:hypothetical protein [Pangasius djambal]